MNLPHWSLILAALFLSRFATTQLAADEPLYADDPAIVQQLRDLKPGHSLLLPKVKHLRNGEKTSGEGYQSEHARDYTNRMAYAPDRGTALYCGGNHGPGRTNAVWEFHLGSNSWHQLHQADGGDHARFKFALMFYPRMTAKDPNVKLTESQQKEVDECQQWWKDNVVLRDGNFLMKESGAPLLVGHTWDTLIYDPINRRMIQGYGAHNANVPWLQHRYVGESLEEVNAKFGKRADGTPWRTPWTFDPAKKQWQPYANASPLAELQGMAGSLLFLPDRKEAIWYYGGQNTPGAPHVMAAWDLVKDEWRELKPNGGVGIGTLALKQKIAPESEQQMVYAQPRQQIVVAGPGLDTFVYDVRKNEWSKVNSAIPFEAHDAKTVFVYDEANDCCLLADPRNNRLAKYDIDRNEWQLLTPDGPGMPKPPYGIGKGYYDPVHRVFVVQPAFTDRMWVFRQ